jgi:hypothetical protein
LRTTVNAIIGAPPAVPVISASGPLSICNGDSVILTSSSPVNNIWNTGDTTASVKVGLAGNYFVYLNSGGCITDADTVTVSFNPCTATLDVKLFIEGYYLGGGLMRSALFNSGITADTSLADSITVELHSPIHPYAVVASKKAVVNTSGIASMSFPAISGEYYIAIKHRNSLETWSAWPVNMTSSTSYDFTDAASKAFGNNQSSLGASKYGLFSGDLNQDGVIESQDYIEMENSIFSILFGYQISDITGDGVVESDDYLLMENNIPKILFANMPF